MPLCIVCLLCASRKALSVLGVADEVRPLGETASVERSVRAVCAAGVLEEIVSLDGRLSSVDRVEMRWVALE